MTTALSLESIQTWCGLNYTGVWIQWNGMVDLKGGMEWWTGMAERNIGIKGWNEMAKRNPRQYMYFHYLCQLDVYYY